MIDLLSSPFTPAFQSFIDTLQTDALICSPYITAGPLRKLITAAQQKGIEETLHLKVVTDLSVANLLQGATDISALLSLRESIKNVDIVYLPRIHAKVYISQNNQAIITSANFTHGGSFANLEYGVRLDDSILVAKIRQDVEQYAELGGRVSLLRLQQLKQQTERLRTAVQEERKSISKKLREASHELQREAEDELLRVRVQGRAVHGIFAQTIMYLLSQRAMATVEIHAHIQEIHPDLCDDTMDRVIDGQHFGKLWKHQVRTAQQHLKRAGTVTYDAQLRLWKRQP